MSEPRRQFTHVDLVTAARRWLRSYYRCDVVLSERGTYLKDQPDAFGWSSSYCGKSVLVECKASRNDFIGDRVKPRTWCADRCLGDERYYFTNPGVIRSRDELPTGWGWVELRVSGPIVLVEAERRTVQMDGHKHLEFMTLLALLGKGKLGSDVGAA